MNNWWVILSGMCWVGAAAQAGWQGNWKLMVIGICYASATFVLEGVK